LDDAEPAAHDRRSDVTRTTDRSRVPPKPFLIAKDEEGTFRITIRETRYNSQSYPIVTSVLQEGSFRSATAARAHAQQHLGAKPDEFASK
jgi:hypothetical protein